MSETARARVLVPDIWHIATGKPVKGPSSNEKVQLCGKCQELIPQFDINPQTHEEKKAALLHIGRYHNFKCVEILKAFIELDREAA